MVKVKIYMFNVFTLVELVEYIYGVSNLFELCK